MIARRLLPPVLVLGAWVVAVRFGNLAAWPASRQAQGLWLLLGAVFLLAWRLQSARVARAALALLLLDRFVVASTEASLDATRLLAAIVVPLDLALVAWLREASLISRRGLSLLGLLAVEAALLAPASRAHATTAGWLPTDLLSAVPAWLVPSVFAIALVFLALRLVRRPTPLAAGWLGVLAAAGFALHTPLPRLGLIAAGLVLLVALVERAFGFAYEDGLTGLPGRRAFDQRLRELGGTFAVAMVDVDHFKTVNDRHGHDVGDQVLCWIAAHLRTVRRGTAYRYGGEEFAVVFPGMAAKEAKRFADEIRARIADAPFLLRDAKRPRRKPRRGKTRGRRPAAPRRSLKVTVSVGVAARDAKRRTTAAVVKAADRALYRAKRAGRNRVAVTGR